MQAPYLLISDLDDTLLGDDEALRRFAEWVQPRRSQLRIVYASGRNPLSIMRRVAFTLLPAPDAVIGSVGTEVRQYPGLEPFDDWYAKVPEGWDADRVRELISAHDAVELQEEVNQSPLKASFYYHNASPDDLDALESELKREGIQARMIYSSDKDLDFLPATMDKGTAAAFIAEHFGYQPDAVCVSGNSGNDSALFEHGFRGIIVGNAHQELKDIAGERDFVAESSHADAVRDGLEHWFGSDGLQAERQPDPAMAAEAEAAAFEDFAYSQSIALMRSCLTDHGFLAATTEKANYHRIWGRDGSVMGLAACLTGEADLMEGCRRTLQTLISNQGPHGEIPSNVDPATGRISYGGTAGRVDANLWFIICCGQYLRRTEDDSFLSAACEVLKKVQFLLGAWEFNTRGFLYVPPTGDWADEYVHMGYVLYDQLLYLQAMRELCYIHRCLHDSDDHLLRDRISRLYTMIKANYWFNDDDEQLPEGIYHEVLYRKGREAAPHRRGHYWMPFFGPAGYGYRFDSFANVLVSLLGVANDHQRELVDGYIAEVVADHEMMLLPAFHPVITAKDEAWEDLQMTFSHTFKNAPHEYHNGGLWPMIGGFYAADLAERGNIALARKYLHGVHLANASIMNEQAWSFPEYVHGEMHIAKGTPHLGWSAAGGIIGTHALRGQTVFLQDL